MTSFRVGVGSSISSRVTPDRVDLGLGPLLSGRVIRVPSLFRVIIFRVEGRVNKYGFILSSILLPFLFLIPASLKTLVVLPSINIVQFFFYYIILKNQILITDFPPNTPEFYENLLCTLVVSEMQKITLRFCKIIITSLMTNGPQLR